MYKRQEQHDLSAELRLARLLEPELMLCSEETALLGEGQLLSLIHILFFDDRKAQTILYCMEDGTLWLTVGNHRYCGKDAALYDLLREMAAQG